MHTIAKFVTKYLDYAWDSLYWVMMQMDVTQWGILAVLFVVSGFMALRTRF
jgi:hypothetical protein